MRYSLEPKNRIYVKGYGFMSFARSMSNKYGKKLADTAKKSATDLELDLDLGCRTNNSQKKIYITRRNTTNYWWIEAST